MIMIIFKPTQNKFFDSYRNIKGSHFIEEGKDFLYKMLFSRVSSKILVSRPGKKTCFLFATLSHIHTLLFSCITPLGMTK